MQTYEHTQRAQWMVLLLAVIAVAMAMGAFIYGPLQMLFLPAIIVLIAIAFTTLSTRVDANGVSWAFTLGWPSYHVAFSEIDTLDVTTTNFWLEGYGIHWTIWHGWLWNVSGYGAVMIRTRDGSRVTIGTDDPQGLFEAITRFRSRA